MVDQTYHDQPQCDNLHATTHGKIKLRVHRHRLTVHHSRTTVAVDGHQKQERQVDKQAAQHFC